jgi:hypothetical protein
VTIHDCRGSVDDILTVREWMSGNGREGGDPQEEAMKGRIHCFTKVFHSFFKFWPSMAKPSGRIW